MSKKVPTHAGWWWRSVNRQLVPILVWHNRKDNCLEYWGHDAGEERLNKKVIDDNRWGGEAVPPRREKQ